MEYKEISRMYRMFAASKREHYAQIEEDKRRNDYSTFHTGIDTPAGELFIATPRELSLICENILRTEQHITSIASSMTSDLFNATKLSLILDEVAYTNAIGDIRSTRRQIKEALETTNNSSSARRFRTFAFLYAEFVNHTVALPAAPKDIRSIYDKVISENNNETRHPDGDLFRKHSVDITGVHHRIVHYGIDSESAIAKAMNDMFRIVYSESMPALIAVLASHFLFEYVHPFYDGNGRTGRYLLSLFLSQMLTAPTILSLSHVILEHRDSYYRAFRTVENPRNRGELTFFVYFMLELIREAQINVITRLEENKAINASLSKTLTSVNSAYGLKAQESQIIFMLMQAEALELLGDVPVENIASFLQIKKQMARQYLGSLEKRHIIEKRRERSPLTFELTDSFKKTYHIEAPRRKNPLI
ncbi:MAG: Fic family protein [Eggerthellaceae bacterium]|jgi:Fic family protein|nr:Fic family protein [Eggerthellaceae bacterium]MCH4221338.1 Fic family protein [Eggerthellaceae bacterium]